MKKNIGNSELVEISKNGILLDNIASVEQYVDAIIKMKNEIIDRKYAIEHTIKNNNWNLITKQFFDDIINQDYF